MIQGLMTQFFFTDGHWYDHKIQHMVCPEPCNCGMTHKILLLHKELSGLRRFSMQMLHLPIIYDCNYGNSSVSWTVNVATQLTFSRHNPVNIVFKKL